MWGYEKKKQLEKEKVEGRPRVVSPPRTITETDIVSFVNLIGLLEPPFIDMEWVAKNTGFGKRFCPGPLIISLGMGLGALAMAHTPPEWNEAMKVEGIMGGFIGLKANLIKPVFPGDTIYVIVEITDKHKTGKGATIMDWHYDIRNQRDETVTEFTETILFLPPEVEAGARGRT